MVLFSYITEKINQLTRCHYKKKYLKLLFSFFLSIYGHPAKFIYSWLKECHVEIKNQTLKLSVAFNIFGMLH